jgi:hypothetical protein
MQTIVADNHLLALFETGHKVLKAEKILKQAGIKIRLIPAPSGLSKGCTLAIRFQNADRRAFEKVLAESETTPESIYRKEREDWLAA